MKKDKKSKCPHCKSLNIITYDGDIIVNGILVKGKTRIYCKDCEKFYTDKE